MFEILIIIIILMVIVSWYGGIEAREIATFHAQLLCNSRGFMVLDQTVALARMRLRRDSSGHIRIKRDYLFEYTDDGDSRLSGAVSVMAGHVIGSRLAKEELIH